LHLASSSGSYPIHHTFPTRRSSDLTDAGNNTRRTNGPGADANLDAVGTRFHQGQRSGSSCNIAAYHLHAWVVLFDPADAIDHPRSEEHTSELQSRFDLVCRRLLEKK